MHMGMRISIAQGAYRSYLPKVGYKVKVSMKCPMIIVRMTDAGITGVTECSVLQCLATRG